MKVSKDVIGIIKKQTVVSVSSIEDLKEFAKRGVTVKLGGETYVTLEECSTAQIKEDKFLVECAAVDSNLNFCILGGSPNSHVGVLNKNQSSRYFISKFHETTRLTIRERYKYGQEVMVEIERPNKPNAVIGKTIDGVVCLFSRRDVMNPGDMYRCKIVKVRENYLFVKKVVLHKTAEQGFEENKQKLKQLVSKVKL